MRSAIMISIVGAALATFAGKAALAQESTYVPGTVWEITDIKTEPGQFENYVDWLNTNWKKIGELGKKEGYVVSYHVYQVNNPRHGEPDLILAVEYKDYMPNAERLAYQKKIETLMSDDAHKAETKAGERKSLRTILSSIELQELKLK